MKIIDSSALIYCYDNGISLEGAHYVIGDLDEEFELVELIHSKIRTNIEPASSLPSYSEAYYLHQYSIMLNRYGGYSFTGMRGFGDVAILALVKSHLDNFSKPYQTSLPLFGSQSEEVIVVTDDEGLSKRIKKEFGDKVTLVSSKQLSQEDTR